MAEKPTPEEQMAQLKQDIDLLTQQLALFKAQTDLDSVKQTQDALAAKILLDALKDQTGSQSALDIAKAQLPFATLQGIKAGITGLTLPTGKEGTVKVAAGVAGTALLRSKRALLTLLATVAGELAEICPQGAVLLTEEQRAQAYTAMFTFKRIDEETAKLTAATEQAKPKDAIPAAAMAAENAIPSNNALEAALLPAVSAGAYGLGFTLDTINSLVKLLRTNRQIDVFDADDEAEKMLGYLLEAKKKGFIANPTLLGTTLATADSLLEKLRQLGEQLQAATDTLSEINEKSDAIAKAAAGDPIKKVQMPTETLVSLLKAAIAEATLLFDSLHPNKKPDAFWAQVNGQVLADTIAGKPRLFIALKAQTVQVTESRWYASDRILATSEVQVAYRLLNADDTLAASGVILHTSGTDDTRIDRLGKLDWPPVS